MKAFVNFKNLCFVMLFYSPLVSAGNYLELSTGLIFVDTPADTARPVLGDFRVGYASSEHQIELALMTAVEDDNVNQLAVDVPSIVSVLYHYIPETLSSIKLHFILGASRAVIDSSLPGIASSGDEFYGVSYGIGFAEHFKSNPRLKLSLDLMQLYRGDELDIYVTSVGVHYDF